MHMHIQKVQNKEELINNNNNKVNFYKINYNFN